MSRNVEKYSAETVEQTLRQKLQDIQMGLELEIQPNIVTFTAVINAWARTRHPEAAEKAEAILDWVIALSSESESDDTISSDELDLKNFICVQPNCIAYNSAITAWIRSPSKDSHNRAEQLLDKLWDSYVHGQDPQLKPNARTFNLVINAIARSREPKCADRAAKLLSKMEELYTAGDVDMEPDAQTFGAIINAYANDSSDPESTDKAARILQEMNSLYQMGYENVKPNTFVYNACLNAFAKREGNADQATQLLEMMEQQYAKGDSSLRPDVISYSTCINAHANSKSVDSGPNADAILRRMTQMYLVGGNDSVKPNAVSYTATIKAYRTSAAAAASDEDCQRRTAERAEQLLTTMCLQYLAGDRDQKPTKVTFELVFEAFANIGDKEGVKRIGKLRSRILDHNLPRREPV